MHGSETPRRFWPVHLLPIPKNPPPVPDLERGLILCRNRGRDPKSVLREHKLAVHESIAARSGEASDARAQQCHPGGVWRRRLDRRSPAWCLAPQAACAVAPTMLLAPQARPASNPRKASLCRLLACTVGSGSH